MPPPSALAEGEVDGRAEVLGHRALALRPDPTRIEEHGVPPRAVSADHVDEVRISDVDAFLGVGLGGFESEGEDPWIGLGDANHRGIEHEVEMARETGFLERALD